MVTIETSTKLHKQGIGMLIVLSLEYILGVTTNLFVKFPDNIHGGSAWNFAWRQVPLALHIVIGFLLFFGALVLLIRSIINKDKTWIISSSIAFIAVLMACVSGSLFVSKQTEFYSYLMAISFIVAFLAYFYGIYTSKK